MQYLKLLNFLREPSKVDSKLQVLDRGQGELSNR